MLVLVVDSVPDMLNVRFIVLNVGVIVEENCSWEGGSLSMSNANLFGEGCGACDKEGGGVAVREQGEGGTIVHIVLWFKSGFAMLFCHAMLFLSM